MNNTAILFNKSILDKFLASFGDIADYKAKFDKIQGWKKSVDNRDLSRTKEESIQGKFLTGVFEEVLGYTTSIGKDEWNQEAEIKSILDSTQADGGLGFFTKGEKIVKAVIELKDAKTDIDKKQNRANRQTPIEQAFSYAHKHGSNCCWVIISNFAEIRLYHSSSSLEYERFYITDLDNESEFKRFYFLLCKENLIARHGESPIDKLYKANENARTDISTRFYQDYKNLRQDLYNALKSKNEIDHLTLFGKAQKILDRFLFICFCESTNLLPQGVFGQVIQSVKSSFIMLDNRLWNELKGLFHSIDKGNPPMQINGYNGGLFAKDDLLDSLLIPDDVLENFQKLTTYDFGSDLNVNILGHIFEHSLADIEEIKAEIGSNELQSKQKADGIYYTPNYVTKFIIEKTVGRFLADEKERIKRDLFSGGEFIAKGGKLGGYKVHLHKWEEIPPQEIKKGEGVRHYRAVLRLHEQFWETYIERLKIIKILDPSCGSGAFLNCAFDYLAEEGKDAVEMHHSLLGGQMTLFDWDTHILQNNLYGVDLNAESVEITKLSLWLKTARKDKELASLDNNIKCGNSIINAGDNTFNWNKDFAEIMADGGFDIVIGNPPYGASLNQAEKDYLTANYTTTEYNFDTYKTFMELGLKLTKNNGYMGYITPNTFFVLEKGANKLRKFLFENHTLLDIVELFNVFPTAVVEPAITIFKKALPKDNDTLEVISIPRKTNLAETFITDGIKTEFRQKDLREREGYIFNYKATEEEKRIIEKIRQISKPLSKYFQVTTGVKPYQKGKGNPSQTAEIVKNKPFEGYMKHDDSWKPYIRGKNIEKYTDLWDGEYVKYGVWLAEPRKMEIFSSEKLFIRQTGDYPIATFDKMGKIGKDTIHCIYRRQTQATEISLKYLLGLINSKLMRWIFQYDNFHMVGKPFACVKVTYIERLPIILTPNQQPIITLVDNLLTTCQSRHDKTKTFTDYIKAIYNPKKLTERLQNFYKHDFATFIKELKKQTPKLLPKQEIELMPLFNEKKAELSTLTQTINKLDNELDEMVFKLYNISSDERKIIINESV